MSRLTRSVAFLSKLLAADVEIRFVDLPAIEGGTGKFLLHQMASVAELEAGMISDRTKRALAAAKARGVALGGFRGRAGTSDDTALARGHLKRNSQCLDQARLLLKEFELTQAAGIEHLARLRKEAEQEISAATAAVLPRSLRA